MAEPASDTSALELATELTVAWLANPNTRVSADEVPAVLARLYEAVGDLSNPPSEEPAPAAEQAAPAVSVRKSLASKDHLISLLDGKPYKTLRRHLARHGLTPEQYRERFGLKADYPMVSEAYSQVRRDMAKKIGLGRKPRQAAESGGRPAAASNADGDAKPRRGRPRKMEAAAAE